MYLALIVSAIHGIEESNGSAEDVVLDGSVLASSMKVFVLLRCCIAYRRMV